MQHLKTRQSNLCSRALTCFEHVEQTQSTVNSFDGLEVMHGATFPVYDWQKFLTHPFADFFSLPWEEFVLEHNRHHASTVDLLIQGEFGWDPEVGLPNQCCVTFHALQS